jgi:hypothetical protein
MAFDLIHGGTMLTNHRIDQDHVLLYESGT